MEGTESLQFCSILGPNSPLKNKNFAKNKNSRENYIYRNIK